MTYVLHLIAPRPTFVEDMTDEERAVMADHATYWRGLLADGVAVAFGPVLDPAGPYGLAIVDVPGPDDVDRIIAADPAVLSGLTAKVFPMPGAVLRPHTA